MTRLRLAARHPLPESHRLTACVARANESARSARLKRRWGTWGSRHSHRTLWRKWWWGGGLSPEGLNRITEAEVIGNSGRRAGRYLEPEEAASELLSKAIKPHLDQLEKLSRRGNDSRALVLCEAIILALYRLKASDQFAELEEYAGDFPEETAGWAAQLWRAGGDGFAAVNNRFDPDRTIPTTFVNKHVPDWAWLSD
jgi:hypothetical protein